MKCTLAIDLQWATRRRGKVLIVTACCSVLLLSFFGGESPAQETCLTDTLLDEIELRKLGSEAIKGSATAQFQLGCIYEFGIGISVRPVLAYAWYNAAAAQLPEAEEARDGMELSVAEIVEGQELTERLLSPGEKEFFGPCQFSRKLPECK